MDRSKKFLLKRRIERKLSILSQLKNYDEELFKERVEREKEELKRMAKELVSESPKLFSEDLELLEKVYEIIK
ncbi:MAG TPA: hypothetical protein ENO40_07070 [Desulfurella acetivorans]|nr:hypothetical protein [Desulfurella acetivorans]